MWVKTPVVVPPWARQLVVGFADNPQQVPRAVIAVLPADVTLAPKVALVEVIADFVGEVTVGGSGVV